MFVAGIDDIGTMHAKSEGWSYFVIPEDKFAWFSNEAATILKQTKLKAFHGKDFKRRFSDHYSDFISLIKTTLKQSSNGLIASTLLNQKWKADYRNFCKKLIKGAYGQASISNDDLTAASMNLADPLFTLQRFTADFGADSLIRIEIDSDATLMKLGDIRFEIEGIDISSQLPIKAFYNGYRDYVFKNAPFLSNQGVKPLRDENSFVIQAADILGNFSTAYIFYQLGKKSNTIKKKADIFREHFGDDIDSVNFRENVEIQGDDLVLKADGAFTFIVQ